MPYGVSAKQFALDLYAKTNEDNVWNGAAALGYYLTLSIFPAFIVIFTVIPYLPIADVDEALMDLLNQALPEESAQLLEGTIAEITQQQRGGLLSFGILFTLWTVSTGMYAIMQQLNITNEVKEGRSFVVARIVAIVLSITFVALVIGAFALIVLGGVMEAWVMGTFGDNQAVVLAFRAFRWIVIVLALLAGFALIYHFGPNVRQRFALVTPGSVLGVVLLIGGSLAFTIYIRNFSDYDATYGSVGAVIILMLWLYLAGLVLLVGSEINALAGQYRAAGGPAGARPGGSPRDAGGEDAGAARPAHGPAPRFRPGIATILLFGLASALAERRARRRD